MDYNIKLNIKSLIKWEQLTQKPYSEFEPTEDNLQSLLYCILIANNDNFTFTFEEYKKYVLTDKQTVLVITTELADHMKMLEQFKPIPWTDEETDEETETEPTKHKIYISRLLPLLIDQCHLSVDYVMDKMQYTEIDMWLQYLNLKEKNILTTKRIFTYLTMLPHLNPKKKITDKDILPFEWEKKEKEKINKKKLDDKEALNKLHNFLNSGKITETKE